MSDTTTEVVTLPLKPGIDLSAGEQKTLWEDGLAVIAKQPGAKRVLWGRHVEDQDTVQLIVDWDSLESHQAFIQSPSYKPFLENLGTNFLAGPASLSHVKFPAAQIAKGDPFTAPVTEYLSLFFKPDYDSSEFDAQFASFQETIGQIKNAGTTGDAGGWALEKQGHEALGEGVQGQLFVFFTGWESLEAHKNFAESEHMAKVAPYLQKGPVAMSLRHIVFEEYKK